jgi:hypothetical protein
MAPSSSTKPWLSALSYLGFQLTGWLEHGDHGLTFEDVYDGLDNGTLRSVLTKRTPDMDLGLFTGLNNQQGPRVIAALARASEGLRGRERRKLGLETNGMCLLLAFVLEALQSQDWEPPTK